MAGPHVVDHNAQPLGSVEVAYVAKVANQPEALEVVVDPIGDRDPVEANSLLPRHGAVVIP